MACNKVMTDDHKKILQQNLINIRKNMSQIRDVLDVLFKDGIITLSSMQRIMNQFVFPTTEDQARELVLFLPLCGDIAFYGLIVALVETNQTFIAKMLDPNLGVDGTDSGDLSTIELFTTDDFKVETMNDATKFQVSGDQNNYKIKKADCYGRAIIINNETFEHLKQRNGTNCDAELLKSVFEKLHFHPVVHQDKTAQEIEHIIQEESELPDHEGYQAFILCILSHGARDSVFGTDGYVDDNKVKHKLVVIENILNAFDGEQCTGLRGKPKFIFIQACQSGQIQLNDIKNWEMVPPLLPGNDCGMVFRHADILLMLSTVAGDVSWRNPNKGSYFMRALAHVLAKYSKEEHIDDMMTRVVRLVSSMRIITNNGTTLQQPEKRSTLNRKFYFMP